MVQIKILMEWVEVLFGELYGLLFVEWIEVINWICWLFYVYSLFVEELVDCVQWVCVECVVGNDYNFNIVVLLEM